MTRSAARMWWSEPLPYDAEVEYLESTGTQYISTMLIPTRVHVGLKPIGVATPSYANAYFGVNNNGSRTTGLVSETKDTLQARNYGYDSVEFSALWGEFHNVYFDRDTVSIDGETKAFVTNFSTVGGAVKSFGLFDFPQRSTETTPKSAISYCKMWDKVDNLMADFIPVRVGAVGYMYDCVSGRLFGNSGTGEFILGPDKVSAEMGGNKCLTLRHSYIRSLRSSARFCAHFCVGRWQHEYQCENDCELVVLHCAGLCAKWTSRHVGRNRECGMGQTQSERKVYMGRPCWRA